MSEVQNTYTKWDHMWDQKRIDHIADLAIHPICSQSSDQSLLNPLSPLETVPLGLETAMPKEPLSVDH